MIGVEAELERDVPMNDPIPVKRGWWLYAGSVKCAVLILRRDVFPGTGGAEDPPEVADDRDVTCYELRYEIPNAICPPGFAGGGYYLTVDQAAAEAATVLGVTLRWE